MLKLRNVRSLNTKYIGRENNICQMTHMFVRKGDIQSEHLTCFSRKSIFHCRENNCDRKALIEVKDNKQNAKMQHDNPNNLSNGLPTTLWSIQTHLMVSTTGAFQSFKCTYITVHLLNVQKKKSMFSLNFI